MLEFHTKVAATLSHPSGAYSTTTGEWVAGAAVQSNIAIIAPQPTPGRLLQLLPEGERVYAHLVTWTEAAVVNGDSIIYGGRTYRVTTARPWIEDGNYTQVLMREVQ